MIVQLQQKPNLGPLNIEARTLDRSGKRRIEVGWAKRQEIISPEGTRKGLDTRERLDPRRTGPTSESHDTSSWRTLLGRNDRGQWPHSMPLPLPGPWSETREWATDPLIGPLLANRHNPKFLSTRGPFLERSGPIPERGTPWDGPPHNNRACAIS